eukprot:Polyplicarium_translucidae@DN1790_c0_g1_i1.p2
MVGAANAKLCLRKAKSAPVLVPCHPDQHPECEEPGDREVWGCSPGGSLIKAKGKPLECINEVAAKPRLGHGCQKGFQYTADFAGGSCLGLIVEAPTLMCPKPNLQLGPGMGDLDTPEFKWDGGRGVC